MQEHTKEWQDIAQEKRSALNALIPDEWRTGRAIPTAQDHPNAVNYADNFLTKLEAAVTEDYTAEQLIEKIAARDFTAVEVTRAFCHRAVISHEMTNCISEITFNSALTRAAELDAYLTSTGQTVGPLHGLPVSLKDQFRVNDTETSLGFVGLLGKKDSAETESEIVKILRAQGAVVFVKTNVPTSMMAVETNNNITGYTVNAYNRNLSSGGSSGGEASLIATRGSLLGLGTDIGASIRLPAGVSGLYGLKPSQGRLPYMGVANVMEGQNVVESVVGPLGHSPFDLRLLMKTLLGAKPWETDPGVLPIPWRAVQEEEVRERARKGKLVFGVMRWDSLVMPHPPIQRVIEETVEKLREKGHEVIGWDPPKHSEAFEILFKTFTADSGQEIHQTLALANEPPVPELALSYGTSPPEPTRASTADTISEHWALQKLCTSYRERYLAYWNSTAGKTKSGKSVDAVIMPVAPSASVRKGEGRYFGYTGVANVLDFTAMTVPMGKVDKSVDVRDESYQPIGDMDKEIWAQYDPDTFDGMPVGLQLITRRLEEEKILVLAAELENITL